MPSRMAGISVFISHPSHCLTDHLPHGDGLIAWAFIRQIASRVSSVHVAVPLSELQGQAPANSNDFCSHWSWRNPIQRSSSCSPPPPPPPAVRRCPQRRWRRGCRTEVGGYRGGTGDVGRRQESEALEAFLPQPERQLSRGPRTNNGKIAAVTGHVQFGSLNYRFTKPLEGALFDTTETFRRVHEAYDLDRLAASHIIYVGWPAVLPPLPRIWRSGGR